MAFSHSGYIDARGSTFNQVGRDQTQNTITHNTYIISLFGSGSTPQQHPLDISHDLSQPTSGHEALSPARLHVAATCPSDHLHAVDTAAGFIIRITILLINHEDPSDNYRDLELDLKSLHQTLTLTRLAIEEYENRPLGHSLANTIAPEVQRCIATLSELFGRVSDTENGLFHTIGQLWRSVWWRRWTGDELAPLKTKLCHIRRSLNGFLSALNSVVWVDLASELCAGQVSLKKFHAVLRQRLPALGHIQVHAIQVVDHLGQTLPVPFIFCSRWADFDYIINGFCKDRVGNRYVTQGDYEVMRPEDNRVISRSEFTVAVEPGMVLEMSIILWKKSAFQTNKEKCPRPGCGHLNLNVTATHGWIEWKVPLCFCVRPLLKYITVASVP